MRIVLALVALFTLGAAGPVDWTKRVTLTPGGAYRMGNPAARVRVVEFMSYTCPHCGHFAREDEPKLIKDYVARGTVSYEIRNAARDRLDLTAALSARCGGSARFFGNHAAIFVAQDDMFTRANAFTARNPPAPPTPEEAMKALARESGLYATLKARGVAPAALDACLSSKPALATVMAMTKDAWEVRKIGGTPSFLINDQPVASGTWDTIESDIKTALAASAKSG